MLAHEEGCIMPRDEAQCECGYVSSKNMRRHMQHCAARPFARRVKELEQQQADLERLLAEQQAEIDRLVQEKDELQRRPTTMIHYNNSVNVNHVNIMAYGTEPLPEPCEVRGILIPPETSVARYIALKHFRDPSTSNLRIINKKSKTIQVVEPDINNDLRWTERNRKEMLEKLVDDNLEELTDTHGATRIERWRRWYKSSGFEDEGYDKTDAYRRIQQDVENMLLSQKNSVL